MKHHKCAFILGLSIAISGCSSEKTEEKTLGATAVSSLRTAISQKSQKPLTTQVLNERLSPDVLTQIGLPVMIVELPDRKVAAVVIANEQNGPYENWQAPDGVGITTREGLLISTRGVGFDLMATDISGALPAIKAGASAIAQRTQRYLDGEGQEVAIEFSCSYAVKLQASGALVTESCKSPETAIKNMYWLNSRQKIVKSVQWAGVKNGYVFLEGPITAQ